MKNNDLSYELMEEINDTEVDMIGEHLDNLQGESVDELTLRRQENMVLGRIREEILKEQNAEVREELVNEQNVKMQKKQGRGLKKRKLVALVAAAVMMFSMMAFARANDWDIEFLNAIGLNGAMEELDGGYVSIGETVTDDGITVTAVQSIGDQNHQWVQIDTDVIWDAGEEGYYMFDEFESEFEKLTGFVGDSSASWYSYNNDGKVSFMIQMDVEKINRVKVIIKFGDLCKYEDKDDDTDRILISDGNWELQWKNYYAPNTITKHPMKKIEDKLIHTIVVSPISIRVEATGGSKEDQLIVEKITLENGTEINCSTVGGGASETPYGVSSHDEAFYGENQCIDLDKIKSVTISGVEIEIQ